MAAGLVGFAFFLMELVWYRMLGPLLGGTVFSFGLILAVALLGIGIGGTCYALFGQGRPATLRAFAYTCAIEAAFIAIPFALGDRIALLAAYLRADGASSFFDLLTGWTVIALLVILPPAIVSGFQFPLLVALLGRGRRHVGREIGVTYASNTVGAIVGSIAGGFGLLPLMTAPSCWAFAAVLLLELALLTVILSGRLERRWPALLPPVVISVVVLLLLWIPVGPTPAWRHSGIGVGRVQARHLESPEAIRDWKRTQLRTTVWEAEGIESGVAVNVEQGLAFVLNGKIDGNARLDASTFVIPGLVGALSHPNPRTSLVIGLGTGETSGWLAAVETMERIDTVELEPAILNVARMCSSINMNALDNPKVHLWWGDAREVLLTVPRTYDIIVSQPSNPYRAGIASLFTREYYAAAAERLEPDGLFVQWVQTYDIDDRTVNTIYATLQSVFPEIQTWQLSSGNLSLVAAKRPTAFDLATLRDRVAQEPYKAALSGAWRTAGAEGFLAHYIARPSLARWIADQHGDAINTDDHNRVEFGFARAVGRSAGFHISQLWRMARSRGEDRPPIVNGELDEARFDAERVNVLMGGFPVGWIDSYVTVGLQARARAFELHRELNYPRALEAWRQQELETETPAELTVVAESAAHTGDEQARGYIEQLREFRPIEADIMYARLLLTEGRSEEAARVLERAYIGYRADPWPSPLVVYRSIGLATEIAGTGPEQALRVYSGLSEPFALYGINDLRLSAMVWISRGLQPELCARAVSQYEPHVPWERGFLEQRATCYAHVGHPWAERAREDLSEFMSRASAP
jgi:MFS family permease